MSGPLPDVLKPLTIPASWAYRIAIEARNARYDRGIGVENLNVPVISVGNITTGGTGKTPMVMWIAELLRAHGRHPAIAMRGYAPAPGRMAGGRDAGATSDEALEHAERLPDVPLIVHPDRLAAIRRHLASSPGTDCIILDDGFQHRRVHRDLDLVLIDATRDLARERMLPAGHLREPREGLARADAVIVTRREDETSDAKSGVSSLRSEISNLRSEILDLESQIERFHHRPPLARTRHHWTGLKRFDAAGEQPLPVDWLRGRRLVTLLGVGNPDAVIRQLERAGAIVAANIPAGDHERFSRAKLRVAQGLCDGLDGLVLTGKDWARTREVIDLGRWTCPIIVPQLVIEFVEGRPALEELVLGTAVGERR